MKKHPLFFALLVLLIFQNAQADLTDRVNLNEVDDCGLYHALNGSEAVPEACQENTKTFNAKPQAPLAPQPVQFQINFAFDSARLTHESIGNLQRLVKAMADSVSQGQIYEISGHTDIKGDAYYNVKLSKRRAESVRAFLISKGVNARQLQAQGYGASRLLNSQDPYNGVNRRVEVINITQGN